jgi:hypothetical protein
VPSPVVGLGALLGPTASLALIAIFVALGVLVLGLVMERRDLATRRRMSRVRRPPSESRRAA